MPAGDLRRLLAERPAVAGLAVPGMPGSTPGMAVPGQPHEPYEVVSFARDGKTGALRPALTGWACSSGE